MMMIKAHGGYLYQHRPDVIPQGFMTDEEVSLWSAFYERRAADEKAQHG